MNVAAQLVALFLAQTTSELTLHEREPIAILLLVSRTERPTLTEEILARARACIETRSDFGPSTLDQEGACDHKNRISCWVRSLKDADNVALTKARFLIAIGVLPEEDRSSFRVTGMIIDADSASELIRSADRTSPKWEDAIEDRIFVDAIRFERASVRLADSREVEQFMDGLAESELQPFFARTGHAGALGTLEIEVAGPEVAIEVDGQNAGSARSNAVTSVVDMRPGDRRVILMRSGNLAVERTVHIKRGERVRIVVEQALSGGDDNRSTAIATRWTGMGLAAIGVALVGYAIIVAHQTRIRVCGDLSCPSEQPSYFASFSDASSSRVEHGKGVLIAPLGYSLMITGGIFALSEIIDGERDLPWVTWIAGIAGGVLAYGLSAAWNIARAR